MKLVIVFAMTFATAFAFAGEPQEIAAKLTSLLDASSNYNQTYLRASGRIGELHTRARVVQLSGTVSHKNIVKLVDKEIQYMVANQELFRHEGGEINSLYSLLRHGEYQFSFKSGVIGEYPQYSTDGIYKDLLGMLRSRTERSVSRLLDACSEGANPYLLHLRTWTTSSEYDGMEKIFIQIGNSPYFVILTIDNCGGC